MNICVSLFLQPGPITVHEEGRRGSLRNKPKYVKPAKEHWLGREHRYSEPFITSSNNDGSK